MCHDQQQACRKFVYTTTSSGKIIEMKIHSFLKLLQSEHDETNHQSGASTFIPHETLSLQIYWKVLFAMFQTDSLPKHGISQDVLWEMIQQSSIRSCGYFVTIQMREHRDAWADLLCFSLTNILRLPKPNVSFLQINLN